MVSCTFPYSSCPAVVEAHYEKPGSGSKRNWRTLSKAIHRALIDRPVYALDLRNHGMSPHVRPHTYQVMAEDVQNFLHEKGLKDASVLGHSM